MRDPKKAEYVKYMDNVFEGLKMIKESGEICKRDESMIDELLELHEKWVAEAPH